MRHRAGTDRYTGKSVARGHHQSGLTPWRSLVCGCLFSMFGCQSPASVVGAERPSLGELPVASSPRKLRAPSEGEIARASDEQTPAEWQPANEVNYRFESPRLGPIPVLVRVPAFQPPARLPVLIVLHGRGEAQKSPERGARAFIDDYALEQSWQWLTAEPHARIAPPDVPPTFRKAVESQLDAQPFRGMVVVMPYLPDRFKGPEVFANAPEYARVLAEVIERVKAELPVRQEPQAWALDGISLGGRVAMACAPELATHIGAQGAVQAAIDERELALFAELLDKARKRNPELRHTLATSEHDYFRGVLEQHHQLLQRRLLTHDWVVLPGDHSYAFNRGPGVTHLLLTYDRWFAPGQ